MLEIPPELAQRLQNLAAVERVRLKIVDGNTLHVKIP